MIRCSWVNLNNPLYVKYHDTEWGVPVHSDWRLFEFLTLEGAQAGLSWETILKKRHGYRKAFKNYDVEKIARMAKREVSVLMKNNEIVKNRLKIESVLKNAQAFLRVQSEFGSFSKYLWAHVDNKPIVQMHRNIHDIPATTELSKSVSKDLKKRGFTFVGPTIIYAFMQAVGIVDDHTIDCFRYSKTK